MRRLGRRFLVFVVPATGMHLSAGALPEGLVVGRGKTYTEGDDRCKTAVAGCSDITALKPTLTRIGKAAAIVAIAASIPNGMPLPGLARRCGGG